MSEIKFLKLLLLLENALDLLCEGLVPNLLIIEVFGAFRSVVDNFCNLMEIKLDNDFNDSFSAIPSSDPHFLDRTLSMTALADYT